MLKSEGGINGGIKKGKTYNNIDMSSLLLLTFKVLPLLVYTRFTRRFSSRIILEFHIFET